MSLRAIHAVLDELDADLRRHARAPIYLIGSAAVALAGATVEAADLDLLSTPDDAERLAAAWASRRDAVYLPAGAERFRSRFARYAFVAMPVEVMGGLEVCVDGAWQALRIEHSHALPGHADGLRLPTVAEQLRVLALFDRPKDRRRMQLLQALPGAPA